jgi:hypothetical protein
VTGLRVDQEFRRGPDSVWVVIVAVVEAADVAEALDLTSQAVIEATGDELAGWDLACAAAEVHPREPLAEPACPAPTGMSRPDRERYQR